MQTDWISAALGVWSAELGLTAILVELISMVYGNQMMCTLW